MCEIIKLPRKGQRMQETPSSGVSIFNVERGYQHGEALYISSFTAARISLFYRGTSQQEVHKDAGVVKIELGYPIERVVVEGPTAPVSAWFESDIPKPVCR